MPPLAPPSARPGIVVFSPTLAAVDVRPWSDDKTARKRAREIATELTASPLLPILGYTKLVESFIAGGPLLRWAAYASVVTAVWVYADHIKRRAADAVGDVASDGG